MAAEEVDANELCERAGLTMEAGKIDEMTVTIDEEYHEPATGLVAAVWSDVDARVTGGPDCSVAG